MESVTYSLGKIGFAGSVIMILSILINVFVEAIKEGEFKSSGGE